MRTKLFLTAIALVALFASCTKDEFAPINQEVSSERALVENVTFKFIDEPATRLGFGTDYYFEAGDQLGACLMDNIVNGKYEYPLTYAWYQRFSLVDYIQTNYKFTRDAEGNWVTEAKLCEGNYFMAFPYNKNQGLREAYEFSCANQTIEGTDDAGLKKAFVNNTAFVGYAAVSANDNDSESVAVDMTPVFESNGFVLNNTGTQAYTVEKIVLSGKAVSSYAVVKPTQVSSMVDTYTGEYDFDIDDKGVLKYTYGSRINVALTGGNTVASKGSIRVIVMTAPNTVAADDDAVLEIHTDKGLIRGIKLNNKYHAGNATVAGSIDAKNVLTDKALSKLGKADKVEVTFDDTSIDVPSEMEIYNTDELYRFIKWNKNVKGFNIKANLKGNVALTAAMYEILKKENVDNGSKLTINGSYNVTIDADVEADAMDLVTFTNVAKVVVKGTQTIKAANAQFTGVTEVVVNEDATLNLNRAIAATVTNDGTVNVAIAKNPGRSYTVNTLTNNGTVTVDGYKLTTTALTNTGIVNVNSTLDASGINKENGVMNIYGTLTGSLVNDKLTRKSNGSIKYYPTINNYGVIDNVINNNIIVVKAKNASVNKVSGTGEIDNTVVSAYIRKVGDENTNTVVVTVADRTASALEEITKDANATRAYISGVLTIDPAEGKTVVEVTKLTEVITNGNLNVTGKGKVWFKANPAFNVSTGTKTIVDNGSILSIGNGILTIDGTLTIANNAEVICGTINNNSTVE